jgi:hypothetical protein
MFIDKDSFKVNGVAWGTYLTEILYEYNKLWSSDVGRNLSGKMTGTLIGIFPKFVLQFKPLNKEELEYISSVLDSPNQSVTYYDPSKKKELQIQTYSGDWSVRNKKVNGNEGFNCSLISVSRRK